MEHKRFEGKVAVVIGGASGMGRAIAQRLVAEGAKVVVGDVQRPLLDELAAGLGAEVCVTRRTDVTVEADVRELAALAIERFGRLDIGINCAGGGAPCPILNMPLDQWVAEVNLNFTGCFLAIKHLAGAMVAKQTPGVVICLSSVTSTVSAAGLAAYSSAKAGLNQLIRVAAVELAPQHIRVLGVAPGLIHTPMTDAMMGMPEVVQGYLANVPSARVGQAEEVAAATLFLASDEAAYINGDLLKVDGGQHVKGWTSMV